MASLSNFILFFPEASATIEKHTGLPQSRWHGRVGREPVLPVNRRAGVLLVVETLWLSSEACAGSEGCTVWAHVVLQWLQPENSGHSAQNRALLCLTLFEKKAGKWPRATWAD